MNTNVKDNREKQSFELDLDGGLARADYRIDGGTIVFTHTEVPAEMRRQGHGEALARGALDLVRERNLKVVAQCPFIRAFIDKHPAYQDLLANE